MGLMASFAARAPPVEIRKPQRTKTKNIRRILQIRITTNKHEFTRSRYGAITFNYWTLISQYSPRSNLSDSRRYAVPVSFEFWANLRRLAPRLRVCNTRDLAETSAPNRTVVVPGSAGAGLSARNYAFGQMP